MSGSAGAAAAPAGARSPVRDADDAADRHPEPRPALRPLLVAGLAAAATIAAIVLVHRWSPRTFVSAHGFLHAAVVDRLGDGLLPASVPPENPFFAGRPLPYYWIYHWLGARVAGLFDVHALAALEILNLVAVAITWLAGAELGRRLHGGLLPAVAVGLAALGGANALGAPVLGLRFLTDGAAVLVDRPGYLWGIAHPMLGLARIEDPYALYGPLINFFLNVTSRPLSLAMLLASALGLLLWVRGGRRGGWVLMTLAAAFAAALSPLVGGAGALSLAGGCCVAAFLARRSRPPRETHRPAPTGGDGAVDARWPEGWLRAAAGLGLGVALSVPTYAHLFGLGTAGIALEVRPRVLVSVAASAFVLVALTAWALWRSDGPRRRFLVAVAAAAAVLLAASVTVRLAESNDSNFFHAAAFLLAVPAAGAFVVGPKASRRRRMLAWAVAVLLFVPTPLVVLASYLDRPSVPLALEGEEIRRAADDDLARVYEWIRSRTEEDAVVVIDPRPPIPTSVGNFPELPAITGRSLFTAHERSYVVEPNPDAGLRHRIAIRLVEGSRLSPEESRHVDALERPVYVLTRTAWAADGAGRCFRAGELSACEVP